MHCIAGWFAVGCKSIEVLRLSHVKVLDRGLGHLLHVPLENLRDLDLSHTLITSKSLELLPQGMWVCMCVGGREGVTVSCMLGKILNSNISSKQHVSKCTYVTGYDCSCVQQ